MLKLPGLPVALLLTALLAFAGCGGDEDPSDGATRGSDDAASSGDSGDGGDGGDEGDHEHGDEPFDVCGLLEPADLEAAFGSPWDAGDATYLEQTGGDQCVWGNTDPPPVKQFSIVVMRDGHLSKAFEDIGVTVKSLHEETKEYMTDLEELDLGDDAYLSGSTVAVLDGDTSYTFSTVLGDSPEAIAGLKKLAEQVVG